MSELSDKLQRLFSKLHDTCKGYQPSTDVASEFIKSIGETCRSYCLNEKEKAFVCSHILSEEYGILVFLRTILQIKEVKNAKVESFRFLDDIIDNFQPAIVNYGVHIKGMCVTYVKCDTAAEVRKAALTTLSKILETCAGTSEGENMEITTLINDLYFQLSQSSKLVPSVKGEILCLLGVIAHHYPQCFIGYSEKILKLYLQELKQQTRQVTTSHKKLDQYVVSGCLLGLKEYLYNFSISYVDDADTSYKIFSVMNDVISWKYSGSNYNMRRAGLQLLAAHASQFGIFLYDKAIDMYKELADCVNHQNRDLKKAGHSAIDAFLKQVVEVLTSKIMENKKSGIEVFNFFMSEFRNAFVAPVKDPYIAIIGYGLFAAPCRLYLGELEVQKMLVEMIQRTEHSFLNDRSFIEDRIINLPSHLEALSCIIAELNHIPDMQLFSLEKLLIFQLENFPYVASPFHFSTTRAVVKVLLSMKPKSVIFKGFLSRIVYQALVRTCSHSVVADVEARKANKFSDNYPQEKEFMGVNAGMITYKNYLNIWNSLLNVVQLKELSSIGVPLEDRQSLKESIYDEIINSILLLVSKLNLNVKQPSLKGDENEESSLEGLNSSSDPLYGMNPENLKDFHIFINIVDFSRELLSSKSVELFRKWVYLFGMKIIHLATRYPYVSGFYKLIALDLSICSEIKYFKGFKYEDVHILEGNVEDKDKADAAAMERVAGFHLFSKFAKEVMVQLQQYKDDLLASCLQVLLALPTEIVRHEIQAIIPALQITFKVGYSFLPLAKTGLHALEHWCKVMPEVMEKYYPQVLPYLNVYLTTSGLASCEKSSKIIPSITKSSSKGRHKISAKYVKLPQKNNLNNLAEDSELEKIQLQILHFLGNIGGKNNSALLAETLHKVDESAIAWDFSYRKHLKYAVPFSDMKPEIYFDDFLPRVLELATKSSDRHIKVGACEVLHSLVLYMVGRGSQMPDSCEKKYSMDLLYKHLFPGLLELACDVEQVAKQLFQPLVLQLIHWFSNSKLILSGESSVILLSLWDSVSERDPALRDFSSLCLKEFFAWALKQVNLKTSGKLPSHVGNIFKKMCSFCQHPSPFKRLGAALVFNNIYTIFRNQEILVKTYTLELLVNFVDSLAIAHNDDKSLGTCRQYKDALDHLGKILKVKANLFQKANKITRKPECLEEATLNSCVYWLMTQCGSVQTELRHKCMELVDKLSPLLSGVSSTQGYFLQLYNEKGQAFFLNIFENKVNKVPPCKAANVTFTAPVSWLEELTACLECYNWAFSTEFLNPFVFDGQHQLCLFQAIKFFLEEISSRSLSEVIHIFCSMNLRDPTFSPNEILQYNWNKCTAIIRLFTLMSILQEKESSYFKETLFSSLCNAGFWKIVLLSVIDPLSLGFDTTDLEVSSNLVNEGEKIIGVCMSSHHSSDFIKFCHEYLSSQKNLDLTQLIPININFCDKDYVHLCQILQGYQLLISGGVWPKVDEVVSSKDKIIGSLLDSVWDGCITHYRSDRYNVPMNPASTLLAKHIINTAYSLGLAAEQLVSRILDSTWISSANEKDKAMKGMIVFHYIEEDICCIAAKLSVKFIPLLLTNYLGSSFDVLTIIIKLLNTVAGTRDLRKKYGTTVVRAVLECWKKLSSLWEGEHESEGLYISLSVLTKLLLIDSEVALNTSGQYQLSLLPAFICLLTKTGTNLEFKVGLLDLLPFFLDVSQENLHTLRSPLEKIIVDHFPIESSELVAGSTQYNSYVSAVKKLLSALELTKNELVLEILIMLFCKETNHVMGSQFQKSILQLLKRLPPHSHQHYAEIPYGLTKPDVTQLSPEMKFSIMDQVCLTFLRNIALSAFIGFYAAQIKQIMNIVKDKRTQFSEEKLPLVSKIGAFKLLELLYSRLSKEHVHAKESSVVSAYVGGEPATGKELTTDVTKFALEFKRKDFSQGSSTNDLRRKLYCSAFNALIAVVSCTQNDLKFYNAFLFKENTLKGECIWENIIDIHKDYTFDIELDAPLERKKKFVSIRHNLRAADSGNDPELERDKVSSLHFMASEHLTLSSLADEVSQFDFSTSELVFSKRKAGSQKLQQFNEASKNKSEGNYIEMESDELNQHECMSSVVLLLNHMATQGLISETGEGIIPVWLESITQKLEDPQVHKNIKLFLGRVIINCEKILKPYGKYLLNPLMELIVSGTLGQVLHYYILDVIVTLLLWAPDAIPENSVVHRHSASCVLEFMFKNADHPRKEIFRNNLEVIKTILECWKGRTDIPYRVIYNKMGVLNLETRDGLVGIQLLGLVISNDFPPYLPDCKAEGQSVLNSLIKNMNHKYKDMYASAAEVIGLVLRFIQEKKETDAFYEKVATQLDKLCSDNYGKNKFVTCLYKIHISFPEIADKYFSRLLYLQPSLHGNHLHLILEILCSRIKYIPDAYNQLNSIGMFKGIQHKDESFQLHLLKMLKNVCEMLTCDEILSVLPEIVEIHSQPAAQCRMILYLLLMPLFDKYRKSDGAKEKEITRLAQETLLKGLGDPDLSIRLTVDNFWSDEARLPSGTKDRFITLMKSMYSPSTEGCFLQYATFLLLERTSHSPDYKRKIFEHPLSQCDFRAYNISTSWRQRHAAMSPMFAESVTSDMSLISGTLDARYASLAAGNANLIQETLPNQDFSITQDSVRGGTFNWLTEKSVYTFRDWSSLESGSLDPSSSLSKSHLYASKTSSSYKMSKVAERSSLVKAPDGNKTEKLATTDLRLLRRRFLKDRVESEFFAKQERRRQEARDEMRREQKSRREHEVTMYRQYRIGELPDIEILNSSVIVPLQALAQNDATIAKMLFKSLLIAISEYVKTDYPEDYSPFSMEIGECLNKILHSSTEYVPPVISFCLESLQYLQNIKLDPENVYIASQGSNLQAIGIILLEEKILQDSDIEPKPKKSKLMRQPIKEDLSYWIKLAELYRSLDEYDVVNGIFSQIMGNREQNQKALSLEASGCYLEAVNLYQTLFSEATEDDDQAEKDFWDNSILYCYDKLTSWNNLEQTVLSRFTNVKKPDLQRVWEDSYYQVYYLPYVMRSKIKLLLKDSQDQSLLTFVDAARLDEEKKDLLEAHFSEELSLLYIIQERYDAAQYYISSCMQQFLKEWKSLSSLAVGVQQSKLRNLQKYVEMNEFLSMVKKDSHFDFPCLQKSVKQWLHRLPSMIDPINVWEDMDSNRNLYLRKLKDKVDVLERKHHILPVSEHSASDLDSSQLGDDVIEDADSFFFRKSAMLKLLLVQAAAVQGNVAVAKKHLQFIHKIANKLDESIWSDFIEAYCYTNQQNAMNLCGIEKLKPLVSSYEQLGKLGRKSSLNLSQQILQSRTLDMISEALIDSKLEYSAMDNETKKKLREISGSDSVAEAVSHLQNRSFQLLSSAVQSQDKPSSSSINKEKHSSAISSAHMCLANFCNRLLRRHESDEDEDFSPRRNESFSEYPFALVKSLLSAMQYGNHEAVMLFPRLLQIIELYPDCVPVFKDMTSEIPCWMFMEWINQMVALLDKQQAPGVQGIIQSLAVQYPYAIVYAFHISSESYNFPDTLEGKKNKAFAKRLKSTLDELPLVEDFIEALKHLTLPHVVFKDHIQRILASLKGSNKEQAVCHFKEMWSALFDDRKYCDQNIPPGEVHSRFAKEFAASVLETCGKDGRKIAPKKTVTDSIYNLLPKAKQIVMDIIKSGAVGLQKLSPWLSGFQPWKFNGHLEIPGQYTGRSKPLPQYHVKVAGFDEKVMVLTSIACPCRITIRGNDEKEYKILVKAGEDLRQDSRIQQLFSVMNEIYAKDPACGHRHLQLFTYKVIPLSSRLGIIEWVDNTTVLQDFISDSLTETEAKINVLGVPHSKLLKWIGYTSPKSLVPAYLNTYQSKSKEECIRKYQELSGDIPKGLLRRGFLKLSSSPEAFLRLRSNFAVSHAVICVSQWVLGIGDRHLGNFLVNLGTGGEIGIDFGHAFGSATQFLQLPELVPFRLTPQFLQLMDPLKEKGLFKATMIHTLNALRRNHYVLLNIMDIFIKEPTLDWKLNAVKQQQALGIPEEDIEQDSNWYPKQRVEMARKKLEGTNPCRITREELKLGHGKNAVFKKIEATCLGSADHNIRATLPACGLTAEEQVSSLIDQATDPEVLVRTFRGWTPWL